MLSHKHLRLLPSPIHKTPNERRNVKCGIEPAASNLSTLIKHLFKEHNSDMPCMGIKQATFCLPSALFQTKLHRRCAFLSSGLMEILDVVQSETALPTLLGKCALIHFALIKLHFTWRY